AGARDTLAEHDVEFGLAEGRRDLVLDHLDLDPRADGVGAVLDGLGAPDLHADGGVVLERQAAAGRLRIAEHDADLLADLVFVDSGGVGAVYAAGGRSGR